MCPSPMGGIAVQTAPASTRSQRLRRLQRSQPQVHRNAASPAPAPPLHGRVARKASALNPRAAAHAAFAGAALLLSATRGQLLQCPEMAAHCRGSTAAITPATRTAVMPSSSTPLLLHTAAAPFLLPQPLRSHPVCEQQLAGSSGAQAHCDCQCHSPRPARTLSPPDLHRTCCGRRSCQQWPLHTLAEPQYRSPLAHTCWGSGSW